MSPPSSRSRPRSASTGSSRTSASPGWCWSGCHACRSSRSRRPSGGSFARWGAFGPGEAGVRPVERVADLSVPIYEGMPVDDLGPKFWVRLSHAASRPLYRYTQSREGRVFLTTAHVGTPLDGPLRFDPQGLAVERLPLDRVIRPACLLDLRGMARAQLIGVAELERAGTALQPGDA